MSIEWVVRDAAGLPAMLFHGTRVEIPAFDATQAKDGCLHFGTPDQAHMRCKGVGANLVPVFLLAERLKRMRDTGGWWGPKMKRALAAGFDAIVYLNRYEGIDVASIERASEAGINPDLLSDQHFRRWFPEARDSYLISNPAQVIMAIPSPMGGDAFRAASMEYLLQRNLLVESRERARGMR